MSTFPTSLSNANQSGRQDLAARFRQVRAATLAFAAPLSPEDMMVQSSPDASPVKWHLAHTSWFFETFVLGEFLGGYKPFHPDFHWLFNSYYNALGEMPAKNLRASFSRPPLERHPGLPLARGRSHGRLLDKEQMQQCAENEGEILRRITLGLEHEQQHLELAATDIKHALFTNPLHPAYAAATGPKKGASQPTPPTFLPFSGGLVEIGATPDADDPMAFAFDNETPRHTVFLLPFELADRLVTVADYLAFIDDNGYGRPELWLSEGWTHLRAEGWQAPLYWQRDAAADGGWRVYTLHGFKPVEALAATPVCHLSFFEADAFARWSGCRLPTEFEWEHAASGLSTLLKGTPSVPQLVTYVTPTAQGAVPAVEANMMESGNLHPVHAKPHFALQQMFGDVWEWTASPYTGYPGYKPLPGALGEYNGKFMSSQVILRGGSCVTPAAHIRPSYRNFFPPGTRWQFSGLRLAR